MKKHTRWHFSKLSLGVPHMENLYNSDMEAEEGGGGRGVQERRREGVEKGGGE